MRFVYLLPLGACAHHCCTSKGLVVLRDHTNRVCGVAATVYRREQGPRCFVRKLDSEDNGEHLGEACRKARRRPTCAWEGPRLTMELPNQKLRPCEGLQRGLGRSLRASRYLGKNNGVVDGSLHISILLFSFRIYIDCITPFAVEITTH